MGTLTSLLDLSKSALSSNQAALDIVSKNVANASVTGYTRETVNWSEDVVSIRGQGLGSGVNTGLTAVSQRDRILEKRVQQQTQALSQATAKQSALNQLQTIFGLTSSTASAVSTTLGSSIDAFFNSLSTLANQPTDTASRQAVLSTAGSLATAFQSASSQVAAVNEDLSQSAGSVVDKINSLTTEIAQLNVQIGSLLPERADAGTLEDQRQQAIADLSQYIGLDQVSTESNGITLSTTNGTVLVSEGQTVALRAATTGGTTEIYSGSGTTDLSGQITGGQLGGLLAVQSTEIAPLTSSLDQLAYAIGTAVNTQNAAGLDGNGTAGAALFSLPATATGAAGTLAVSTTDASKIAAAAAGQGSSGNGNANALANLVNATLVSGQTVTGFLTGVLSGLGTSEANATTDQTAQQAALDQITTQRNALSGVSLDEEAASLTQYQRSYQAASKLFSIVDTLLAAAINLGTETTV